LGRRTKSASPASTFALAQTKPIDSGLFEERERRTSHALSGLASGLVGRRSRSNSREPTNRFAHAVAKEQAAAEQQSRTSRRGTRSGAFRVIDAQELAHALSRCDLASADIRESVLSTTGRIDFLVIDRAVMGRGARVLEPLRKSVVQIHSHLLSFLKVAMASQPDAQIHSASSIEFNADNAVTIKSVMVSLRAFANKLPCNPEPADALELATVLDQGLLEQLLSWCSEALSCYSVLYQAFRQAQPQAPRAAPPGFSKPPLVSGNSSNSFRRRQAALIAEKLVQAQDGPPGEGEAAAGKENVPVPAAEKPPVETRGHASCGSRREQHRPYARECSRDAKDGAGRSDRRKEGGGVERTSDRMQRFRPRAIIIPETSWECKNRTKRKQ